MNVTGIVLGLVAGLIGGSAYFLLDKIKKKKAAKDKLLTQNITHRIDGQKVNIEKFVNEEKDYLEGDTQLDPLSEVDRKLPKKEKEKNKEDSKAIPPPPLMFQKK